MKDVVSNYHKKFNAFAGAGLLTLSSVFSPMAVGNEAQEPSVTYKYPAELHYPDRTVPCDTFIKQKDKATGKITGLVPTCETGEALDANNQKVCISGSTNRADPKSVGQSYADTYLHYATGHNMHVPEYVNILRKLGKSETEIANHSSSFVRNHATWKGFRPLNDVRAMCMAEYQKLGM